MKNTLIILIDNLLYSYSMLVFMKSKLVGLMLLCVTLFNPNLALSGLISWGTTLFFAWTIGNKKNELLYSIYTYNSLILGFSIGFLFKISIVSVLIIIGTSILTVMLSYTLYSTLTLKSGLPVLNIPFFIVCTIIYLSSSRYSTLFVDSYYSFQQLNIEILPLYLQGLFRTIGIIMFMPYDITGIIILIIIGIVSNISFFLCIISYYFGIIFLAILKGSFTNAFYNYSAFNFILIGLALGGTFLIPSKQSYLLCIRGVFISVFILDAVSVVWSVFKIPVLTLPFNIVVLLFIFFLRKINYPFMNNYIQNLPEESLSIYLNYTRRFDRITPQPNLPFMGQWTVYQSYDDEWTHQGSWKYAYDFIIKDENSQSYANQGLSLSDYYCFGKPVLAPITGTIIDAYDSCKDNQIGEVDKNNNWGNYAIIYSSFGYYVEISHFQEKSLKVKKGDWVTAGTVLGNCGNSGYSPQPHIHMQLQYWPHLGSETVPFYYNNCINQNRKLLSNTILEKDSKIEPITFSRKLNTILTFILDDSFKYQLIENNKNPEIITISVKMAIDGSYYFILNETNDKLFFGIEQQCFVFYKFEGEKNSPLKYLFAALPGVPICIDKDVKWEIILPTNILFNIKGYQIFFQSLNHNLYKIIGKYQFFNNNRQVNGEIKYKNNSVKTKLIFHKNKGFEEIHINSLKYNITLRLITNDSERPNINILESNS